MLWHPLRRAYSPCPGGVLGALRYFVSFVRHPAPVQALAFSCGFVVVAAAVVVCRSVRCDAEADRGVVCGTFAKAGLLGCGTAHLSIVPFVYMPL